MHGPLYLRASVDPDPGIQGLCSLWVVTVGARSSMLSRPGWFHIAGGSCASWYGIGVLAVRLNRLHNPMDIASHKYDENEAYLVANGKNHGIQYRSF